MSYSVGERMATNAPPDLASMLSWPERNFDTLNADQQERVLVWLKGGIHLTTAYSGIGGAELAVSAIQSVAELKGVMKDGSIGIRILSACDLKHSARRMLLSHKPPDGPEHVFGALDARLPTSVVNILNSLQADESSTTEQKLESFRGMKSFLYELEEVGQLFDTKRRRHCFRHNADCPVFLGRDPNDLPEPPLRLHVAGPTCKDHSRRNLCGLGYAGPSGRPFLVWAFERRAALEDVILVENVDTFDASVLEELMSPTHEIFRLLVSPEDLGWWVSRTRAYFVLIKKSAHLKFDSSPAQFYKQFALNRPMGPECERGDMFYVAPQNLVDQVAQQKWDKKFGGSVGVLMSVGPSWEECMSGRQEARKAMLEKSFQEKWAANNGEEKNTDLQKLTVHQAVRYIQNHYDAGFISDLDQSDKFGPIAMNRMLPCLVTHGEYFSSRRQRALLGQEFFIAQGYDMFSMTKFAKMFKGVVEEAGTMSQSTLKDLAGNGMHLAVVSAIACWTLGSLSRAPATPTGALAGPSDNILGEPDQKRARV